ncbi:MAG: amino acid racemase [Rhodospirillaceae bacterium]|nr:amino acid racemase [Rhodospirillales bacterium]
MATIGIVGGLGPEGTIHYYRKLTAHLSGQWPHAERRPGVVIDHVWMDCFAAQLRAGADSQIIALLSDSLDRLAMAGADVALIAAVTPHKFLTALNNRSSLPVVDMAEATRKGILAAGHTKVGLIGTKMTLTENFFKDVLEKSGIHVAVPPQDDISFLNDLIFGELATGVKTPATRARIAQIVTALMQHADALVVACTDLMDLIDPSVAVIDPIECHIHHAAAMLADSVGS